MAYIYMRRFNRPPMEYFKLSPSEQLVTTAYMVKYLEDIRDN